MQKIIAAIRQNNLPLLHSLLDSSTVDVKYLVNTPDPDRDNKAVLHEAAALGHLDMVRLLVERGADVNNESLGGVSAIHEAAENKHVEVVRYLAEHGSHHVDDVADLLPQGNHT